MSLNEKLREDIKTIRRCLDEELIGWSRLSNKNKIKVLLLLIIDLQSEIEEEELKMESKSDRCDKGVKG